MNKLDIIQKILLSERETLKNALNNAIKARDSSPGAMESHHNPDRNINEKLVFSLQEKVSEFNEMIKNIPKNLDKSKEVALWSLVEYTTDNRSFKVIIVPQNYGGGEYNGIRLVSLDTPIAENLLGKKQGQSVNLNKTTLQVTKIN